MKSKENLMDRHGEENGISKGDDPHHGKVYGVNVLPFMPAVEAYLKEMAEARRQSAFSQRVIGPCKPAW